MQGTAWQTDTATCAPPAHPDLLARHAALLQALAAMDDVMQVAPEVLEGVVSQEAERACR